MSPRPLWLPPTRSAPIEEAELEQLCKRLEQGESRWIQGSAGSGRTKVLAAVATRIDRPCVAVRLAGCRDDQDVLLALGWALESVPCGTRDAIISKAAELDRPLFLLDDADLPALDELIATLQTELPSSSWLCAGSKAAPSSLSTDPLFLPERPLPKLPEDLEAELKSGMAMPQSVHPALLLASSPAGLPNLGSLSEELLLVDSPQRQVMRPAMIEALRAQLPPPSQVASQLTRVYDRTLGLALGGPILDHHRWEDVLTLRWMGEVLADPDRACLASATAARMLVAWGQLEAAGRVLDGAQRRNPRAQPRALAVLAWAAADRNLAQGDLEGAERRFGMANQYLHDAGDDAILARLSQHRSDVLFQRSRSKEGVQLLRTARRLLTVLGDSPGIASTLRCAADLAVANGELLSAETLYDQAAGTETPAQEIIARRIGVAGLALSRGENRRAKRLLEEQSADHGSQILLGNRMRRQADLALREERPEQAASFARRALRAYARGGAHVAIGHTRRLLGDIDASRGSISGAWSHYWQATDVHLHVHDYAGLVRTVQRIRLLEREAGQSERDQALDEAMAEIKKGMAG